MNSKLRFLLNPLLLIFLLGLISMPIVISGSIVKVDQSLGEVAGTQTVSDQELVVYPNFSDFDGYVRFEPTRVVNGRYQDTLTITAFRGQTASYHKIYRVYNNAKIPMKVKVFLDKAPDATNFYSQILISLSPHDVPHYTTLLSDELSGSTVLEVRESNLFADTALGTLGDEVVNILGRSRGEVLTLPLKSAYRSGERFYPQAVLVVDGQFKNQESREVILAPNEYATVSATVVGQIDSSVSVAPVTLDFSIYGSF